jgi:hypothetical protein
LGALLWFCALGMAAVAVWALNDARATSAVANRLEDHRGRLGAELNALNASDAVVPSAREFAELAEAAARLNDLAGNRRTPLPGLLTSLEEALPDEVWISQLAYAADTGAFFVSLLGEEETYLPIALQRIEAIDEMGEVILERQARVRSGTRMLLQYDVRAVAE